MANLFEKKDRHIIPNWRSFENTAKLGELNGSKGVNLDSTFKPDISDLIGDWQESQSMGVAADILGAALVSNQENNDKVKEISRYILQNRDLATSAIVDAAEKILKGRNNAPELIADIKSPDFFNNDSNKQYLYLKINNLKKRLIDNLYNPVNWVEIARYYSILGQDIKAEKAIKNALYISPENRFILRSVARFYVHIGDVELAHDIIRKSELTKYDPWLLATEIGLATLRDRSSRFVKSAFQVIETETFHPFNTTELASSLATLEMRNASLKKSKRLFSKSLLCPNDNSLAQAEWASQKETSLMPINVQEYNLVNSFEAIARDFFEHEKWQEAIDFSKKWFFDLPFSKTPVLFGNTIALNKLKDHSQATELAKLGLLSHPHDPHLLNNIIYSLCLQNRIEEAEVYLDMLKKDDLSLNENTTICLTATRGLYFFRKGFPDIGRGLYLESIKIAKENGNNELMYLAIINHIREEILLGKEDISSLIPSLYSIIKNSEIDDTIADAEDVINLYNSRK